MRRLLLLLLVALAVGALLVGAAFWLTRGDGRITRWRDFRKVPEAQLYYPGSAVLSDGGNDYSGGILGRVGASYTQVLGVDASDAAILAFYRDTLASRGWRPVSVGGTTEDRAPGAGWEKDRVLLQLRFPKPERFIANGLSAPAFYELRLFDIEPAPRGTATR